VQAGEALVPGVDRQLHTGGERREDRPLHRSGRAEPADASTRVNGAATGDGLIRVGVLLAPDRALLASSIQVVLGLEPDFAVVAVDSSPTAGPIRMLAAGAEVVLVDDVSLTSRLREDRPDVKVIVLEAVRDPDITLACIRSGASACVNEATSPAALADVVRRVYAGEAVYEQGILLELVQRPTTAAPARPRRAATLSERELEVLAVLATGASSSEAADRLCISLNTVRTHLKNIMVKLEARSKLEAVIIAIREGRIELPPE
jgi:DNA-binding NarL/FixJ family response regulator